MKKLAIFVFLAGMLGSCKPVIYSLQTTNVQQTQVVLNKKNFKVLGHYQGAAELKLNIFFTKSPDGLIAKAWQDMINKAEADGYAYEGSRVFSNVTIDLIKSKNKVKAIVSGDLIEFTDK